MVGRRCGEKGGEDLVLTVTKSRLREVNSAASLSGSPGSGYREQEEKEEEKAMESKTTKEGMSDLSLIGRTQGRRS